MREFVTGWRRGIWRGEWRGGKPEKQARFWCIRTEQDSLDHPVLDYLRKASPSPMRKINRSCSRRHLHNFFLDGVGHKLCLIVDVQLAHQVELVRFNRLNAQSQNGGNLADRISFGEHFDHFALARSQS